MSSGGRRQLAIGETAEVQVSASFYQYYLSDSLEFVDYGLVERFADGVIAPQRAGMQINSGVQYGEIAVALVAAQPAGPIGDTDVAAECDLHIDSGVAVLSSMDSKLVLLALTRPGLVRVRVQVFGRDAANAADDGSLEHHVIHVWETGESRPRLRTNRIDRIGAQLALVTDHVLP